MEIKRDSYLEQLKIRRNNGMIKIITGIRRCGKSFLLLVLFKNYLLDSGVDQDHIIEIALDGIENEELRDPKKCYQYVKDAIKDDENYYLLLDEVQLMPQFEEVLNSLLRMNNIDIYITGSNSRFLASDIVTEFGGRGDEVRVYPLTFREWYDAVDEDYEEALEEYMTYGGLPQAAQLSTDRQKEEYLKNMIRDVYIKDAAERNGVQKVDKVGSLVDVLASVMGTPTNPTKVSNMFHGEKGTSYTNKTVANHVGYLEDSFLISKANRYNIKGKKYIGTNLKYYFSDVGLRNAKLNFRQQEPARIMENIVYNELLARGYQVDTGMIDAFETNSEGKRLHKQLEVDFIANQGNQRYYIQVTGNMNTQKTMDLVLQPLRNIRDSFKKIIIVNGIKKPWRNEEGFVIMGMKYFLLHTDSLEF